MRGFLIARQGVTDPPVKIGQPVLQPFGEFAFLALQGFRQLALLGAGISLGGTILLNACLEQPDALDGLVCTSSPLDLAACSASIERPRNRGYQRWLLKRLVRQTLADPFGVNADEEAKLQATPPRSIREFDSAVTAPRWGFADIEAYYREASPLQHLVPACKAMPPTLLLQALDDPWVPATAAMDLNESLRPGAEIRTLFTPRGGHNGFHGRDGCWGDQVAAAWLRDVVAG